MRALKASACESGLAAEKLATTPLNGVFSLATAVRPWPVSTGAGWTLPIFPAAGSANQMAPSAPRAMPPEQSLLGTRMLLVTTPDGVIVPMYSMLPDTPGSVNQRLPSDPVVM